MNFLATPPFIITTLPLIAITAACCLIIRKLRHTNEVQRKALRRYFTTLSDVDHWCGYYHPEVRLIVNHIRGHVCQMSVNAGTPSSDEVCTSLGLRVQLDRLKEQVRQAAILESKVTQTVDAGSENPTTENMQLRLNAETLEDILKIAGVTGISVDAVIANVLEKAFVTMELPKEEHLEDS